MNKQEQNTAIANWVGTPADYVGDLNAMHEAEKRLIPHPIVIDYVDELANIVSRSCPRGSDKDTEFNSAQTIRATAAQRAEALLRCLNLWKEP